MSTRIAKQLWEFAERRRAEEAATSPSAERPGMPRGALAALALLPFQRLFAGAEISSRIKDFVYTLS
jgi:hypothetical protein